MKASLREIALVVRAIPKEIAESVFEIQTCWSDAAKMVETMAKHNQRTLNDLWKRNTELENRIEEEVKISNGLREQLRTEQEKHDKEIKYLRNMMVAREEECQRDIKSISEQCQQTLQDAQAQFSKQIEGINTKIDDAEKNLMIQLQEKNNQVSHFELTIEQMKEEYQEEVHQYEAAHLEEINRIEQQFQVVSNQLEVSKQDHKQVTAQLESVLQQLDEEVNKSRGMNAQIEKIIRESIEAKVENTKLESNQKILHQALQLARDQVKVFRREYTELQQLVNQTVQDYTHMMEITNQNSIARLMIRACVQDKVMKEGKLKSRKTKLDQVRKENEEMELRLQRTLSAYNRLSKYLDWNKLVPQTKQL
jgi:chromosome segregation ATPase